MDPIQNMQKQTGKKRQTRIKGQQVPWGAILQFVCMFRVFFPHVAHVFSVVNTTCKQKYHMQKKEPKNSTTIPHHNTQLQYQNRNKSERTWKNIYLTPVRLVFPNLRISWWLSWGRRQSCPWPPRRLQTSAAAPPQRRGRRRPPWRAAFGLGHKVVPSYASYKLVYSLYIT